MTIHVTEAARKAIQAALAQSGESVLRLTVTAAFEAQLAVSDVEPGDVRIDHEGFSVVVDADSAVRADGATVDVVETSDGVGFVVHNPNQPPTKDLTAKPLKDLTVQDLKAWMDAGTSLLLVDVRTPEEWAIAHIAGAQLLDEPAYAQLLALDRATRIVCQCHHGVRSRVAAEHLVAEGFTDVYNLTGGIDAWSRLVDPAVPRY